MYSLHLKPYIYICINPSTHERIYEKTLQWFHKTPICKLASKLQFQFDTNAKISDVDSEKWHNDVRNFKINWQLVFVSSTRIWRQFNLAFWEITVTTEINTPACMSSGQGCMCEGVYNAICERSLLLLLLLLLLCLLLFCGLYVCTGSARCVFSPTSTPGLYIHSSQRKETETL